MYSLNDWRSYELYHYGVKGQKWGVRNGPPYPLKRNYLIKQAIDNGEISIKLNAEKQNQHIKGSKEYVKGRSYFTAGIETLQKYINELSGTGTAVMTRKGVWSGKEIVTLPKFIGVAVNSNTGETHRTRKVKIHYSKNRTHIVPYYKNG